MSWKDNVRNWDGKLYKVLRSNQSCHGGNFEWDLPKDGKSGNWTPIIKNVEMCERGYHLTTHYAHWSFIDVPTHKIKGDVLIYEAEGDVIEFDRYDKVVCSRVRLLRLVENPFNKCNIGRRNSGNYNSGNYNSGNYNSGNYNSGRRNSGNYNSGSSNTGNYNSGYFNSGSWNSGNWNSGDFNFGRKNSGRKNSGNYNSGSSNTGNYNSGYFNSGKLNSGDCNFGDKNSGSFNIGNRNSGYFCIDSPPIRIFGKSAPKDWEPKFPGWMFFSYTKNNSSLEEYHTSWQNAFLKADVNGIKKLLDLPNFNYEIFERITSITKKQIERKLGVSNVLEEEC